MVNQEWLPGYARIVNIIAWSLSPVKNGDYVQAVWENDDSRLSVKRSPPSGHNKAMGANFSKSLTHLFSTSKALTEALELFIETLRYHYQRQCLRNPRLLLNDTT